jgi:hypothetical protein
MALTVTHSCSVAFLCLAWSTLPLLLLTAGSAAAFYEVGKVVTLDSNNFDSKLEEGLWVVVSEPSRICICSA